MALAYFCLFENTDRGRTRAEIRAIQPESVMEAPGWIPRYVAPLDSETTVEGAEIVLARMNAAFTGRRAARGLFNVPYAELRQWLDAQFAQATADTPAQRTVPAQRSAAWYFDTAVRVIAGIVALFLFFVYIIANVWGTFYCIFITPFRRRSLLHTVAETTLIFWMLDWRKTIQALAQLALSGRAERPGGNSQ